MSADPSPSDAVTIRDVVPADLPAVLAMNNAAVPAVNELGPADLERFAEIAARFVVGVSADGDVLGFLIGLPEGVAYDSLNYAWFSARHDRFVYVDRIVVAPEARGAGLARRCYDGLADLGRQRGVGVMLAEVNTRPRNDVSLAFHQRYGFVEAGSQDTEGGAKTVVMLEYRL